MEALDDAVIRYEVCGADRRPCPSESGCSEPTCDTGTGSTKVRAALRNRESINSDHCFEFSPFTLVKVVTQAGFRLEQFYYSSFSGQRFPKSVIYRRRPYLAHTLIAVASMG